MHSPKSRFICQYGCTWYLYSTATSIKRPRPPFCCRKYIIYMVFLPPLSGQQIIDIFTSEVVKYLELNLSHFNCWCKNAWETCQRCFTLSTRRNTVHFNYDAPSVLELELCMGWKCTRFFCYNEFWIYLQRALLNPSCACTTGWYKGIHCTDYILPSC